VTTSTGGAPGAPWLAEVVRHARQLLARDGFAGTTVDAVASAAGVDPVAVAAAFNTAEALFLAAFEDITAELDRSVRVAAAGTSGTPRRRFLAGCRACLEFMSRPDYTRIAILDAPAVLGVRHWHEVDSGAGLSSIRLGLAALHQSGDFPRKPTHDVAVLLFGVLTEAGISLAHATHRGDPEPTVDTLMAAFERLLDRLGAAGPDTPPPAGPPGTAAPV
jgi:AcrR family transcriptional regulator